jgi:hypothetical protein
MGSAQNIAGELSEGKIGETLNLSKKSLLMSEDFG